ncbi:MAG: choice-of-anchor L domain-containing protein, partial [Bacteroidota bacterium]
MLQLAAQDDGIVTHNNFSAQTLVKDIFASGACDNIDLITPIGNAEGIGYFENGTEAIGLSEGIILATGPTWHAQGPNNSSDISGDLAGPNGDNDLNRLSDGNVFDAAGIAFDFVPLDSFVSFRYVFASEEYCEFVGSAFNDVFGFFVSGPGIEGEFSAQADNVAIIPGTDDFVAINSVNFTQNSQYYVANERAEDRQFCGLESVPTPHLQQIQYDGFTEVLTAVLKVQPCQTYHIRLVVGDVSDPFFDSAVFLEAGSFNLGGEVAVSTIGDTAGDTQLFEGCEDAAFRFSRSTDSPLDLPLSVNYYISTASTATAHVDYTALPSVVTIPAGETHVDVPVSSLPDMEEEEEELIRVVLDIPCACYADSADLYIVPPIPLEVELDDVYVCPDAEASMTAVSMGGVAPYNYNWSGGSQEHSQQVDLNQAIQMVTVTDACDQSAIAQASVLAINPPSALLQGTDTICQGDTAWLQLDLEAVFPVVLTYQLNDMPNT